MSAFKSFFLSWFEMFDDAIPVFKGFTDTLSTPLEDLVAGINMPQWLIDIITDALSAVSIQDMSILSFIIGVGVPIYAFATVARYVVTIFTPTHM